MAESNDNNDDEEEFCIDIYINTHNFSGYPMNTINQGVLNMSILNRYRKTGWLINYEDEWAWEMKIDESYERDVELNKLLTTE